MSWRLDHFVFLLQIYYCRDLNFIPPKPEEDPPVPWWNSLCDTSLLVGIIKHGMSPSTLCMIFNLAEFLKLALYLSKNLKILPMIFLPY